MTEFAGLVGSESLPNLTMGNGRKTSEESGAYNCIAWAAEDEAMFWWPGGLGGTFWPDPGVTQPTRQTFVEAFRRLGYDSCSDGNPEDGFDKVVFYVDGTGNVTHAARQVSGGWTSKLGPYIDIEHTDADAVAGGLYGAVGFFMRRPFVPTLSVSDGQVEGDG